MIVDNAEALSKLQEFIDANNILAYDTETTGLDVRTERVIGFGVSNAHAGFYVPILSYDKSSDSLQPVGLSDTAIQHILLNLKKKKLLMFNASFDARVTTNNLCVDLLPALHADVLLMKHTCDEEFPFGLKEVAAKLWGHDVKKEKEEMQASVKANGGTSVEYYKADTGILAKYCVQDVLLTYRLYNHYSAELKKQALEDFYYQDEVLPLYKNVTIPMETAGVQIDEELCKQTLRKLCNDLQDLDSSIQAAILPSLSLFTAWFLNKDYPLSTFKTKKPSGWTKKHASQIEAWKHDSRGAPMFNLLSKHHLKKLFFDTLGEESLTKTPTGQPQVNEEFLEKMSLKYDWCKDLITYNKLVKIKGTYLERFARETQNGRYYASFMQHRTVSGRYAGDLQQLPRTVEDDGSLVAKYTNSIRELVVPSNGYVLVSADYEQLEPTIFAHTSGDRRLQEIFKTGADFYSTVAISTEVLRGVSAVKTDSTYLGTVDKPARQRAKAYALGIAYGMTGYKLKYEIDVDAETADRLVQDYLNAFPELARWINKSHDQAKIFGYVKTESGRVRHMPRAKELWKRYGASIQDSLTLWKLYHEIPWKYEQVKKDYKEFKNLMNNAVNFQVQGLAASIVNRAAIYINSRLKALNLNTRLVMQVHDELVYEVPLKEVEKVCPIIKYIMENVVKLSVPLRTIPQVGLNYRQCK